MELVKVGLDIVVFVLFIYVCFILSIDCREIIEVVMDIVSV